MSLLSVHPVEVLTKIIKMLSQRLLHSVAKSKVQNSHAKFVTPFSSGLLNETIADLNQIEQHLYLQDF